MAKGKPAGEANQTTPAANGAGKRGFFASKLLWFAMILTVAAGAWTAMQRTDRTQPPPKDASGMVRSLADGAAAPAPRDPTLSERIAPAAARAGVSFVLGYAVGWFVRRALKIAAILALLAVGVIYVLHRTGVLADPHTIQQGVDAAGDWVEREGGAVKDFVLGLAPTGFAGIAGMAIGALRR